MTSRTHYSPNGCYVWDAWYMPVGEEIHAYHLQKLRPGATVDPEIENSLGHAVSTDLLHWEEKPPVLPPDPNNPWDNLRAWSGCNVWHGNRGYLFYTMTGANSRKAIVQPPVSSIGLATSCDGYAWERYAGNPIITPDPRWYATKGNPVPDVLDCRDLLVIPDPEGGWLGYYATRQPGEELPETAVIAAVHSDDLVHWEHLPPVYAPEKYGVLEMPEVFEHNGHWFLTCLTGHFYGNRGIFSEPNITGGTIFAVGESPRGPFHELEDNLLIGAHEGGPLSCRTVRFQDNLFMLYTDRERENRDDCGDITLGTITTPKRVQTDGDRLFLAYCDKTEELVERVLIDKHNQPELVEQPVWGQHWPMPSSRWHRDDNRIVAESRTGWGVMPFEVAVESFMYEATITIESGMAAGLALRLDDGPMHKGAVVLLDHAEQHVAFHDLPLFVFDEHRRTRIEHGRPVRLRIVNRLEHVEIYVDDELKLAFCRYRNISGKLGLFVDRAKAVFTDIRLCRLHAGGIR